MTALESVKAQPRRCRIVGVITTRSELRFGIQMSRPPDLFELRLDYLATVGDELERAVSRLPAPLIITARHPAEGGANNLALKNRRELLERFLPQARYVDVELRCAGAYEALLERARDRGVGIIISFHDFASTPSPRSLHAKAAAAKSHRADIFKLATRTDTADQLGRLFGFISSKNVDLAVSAMGIGEFGGISRVALARSGSVLSYASLGKKRIEGQLSLARLRTAFELFEIR
jgi:3-dehydroquinate dehydratase-1